MMLSAKSSPFQCPHEDYHHLHRRPFHCRVDGCNRRFAQLSNVKKHMFRIHGLRPCSSKRLGLLSRLRGPRALPLHQENERRSYVVSRAATRALSAAMNCKSIAGWFTEANLGTTSGQEKRRPITDHKSS
mmetsp:Transcript_19010/g.76268  ORF Transcript_19010/g.76268 Transcript_19010/m.76268 type:complete len:130 (+) Transcript_19010:5472-5861(+)